jgi:uncharacterized protein
MADSATIRVRVQPRASQNEIVGERDGTLIVRLNAAPVEGKANEALCRLLARHLGVGRRSVEVLRGARSRDKVVLVRGLSEQALRSVVNDLL